MEAGFVKKIDRESKCMAMLISSFACWIVGSLILVTTGGFNSQRDDIPAGIYSVFPSCAGWPGFTLHWHLSNAQLYTELLQHG